MKGGGDVEEPGSHSVLDVKVGGKEGRREGRMSQVLGDGRDMSLTLPHR